MPDVLAAYAAAFQRCYPTYTVTFERAKKTQDGRAQFHVVLNGDKGNMPLTLDDMIEATANFNR